MRRRGIIPPALGAVVLAALSGAALEADAARARRVIVKPRPGQKVRAHPPQIVLRAGDHLLDLEAHLTGEPITRALGRAHRGKRTAVSSPSHADPRAFPVQFDRIRCFFK